MSTIDIAVSALQSGISGRIIRPSDDGYDAARAVIYGGMDFHPGAIVRVKSAADIAKVLTTARENGVEIAVRSGGHSASSWETFSRPFQGLSLPGIILILGAIPVNQSPDARLNLVSQPVQWFCVTPPCKDVT